MGLAEMAPSKPEPRGARMRRGASTTMPAWFYVLRLRSGALYAGATTDLNRRYADHQAGRACRTTCLDPPLALVYFESLASFSDARKREAQVKHWSRAKKEALVAGDSTRLQELARSHDHEA